MVVAVSRSGLSTRAGPDAGVLFTKYPGFRVRFESLRLEVGVECISLGFSDSSLGFGVGVSWFTAGRRH